MDQEKWSFIDNEILEASIFAALTRGKGYPVYKRNVSNENKEKFKTFLKQKLREYVEKYKQRKAKDEEHFKNIEKLAKEISDKYGEILVNGRFRIGRTQKLLNLYLKYLWILGKIIEPPHCPFDSIVIGKFKDKKLNKVKWTKFDELDTYKNLVKEARKMAQMNHLSITEWELKLWNTNNYVNVAG